MNNPKLPAGLENKSVEIYVYNHELKAIFNGEIIPFIELPEEVIEIFEIELIKDKVAYSTVETVFKLIDSSDILEQYVKCRYGGFDFIPDLVHGKLSTNPEYWDCGLRGKCAAEGKVCKLPVAKNGQLTPRETEVIRYVAEGLPDKIIAHKMDIAISTVVTYQKRIRTKLGAYSRIDIMKFAITNNLIQ